MTAEAPQTFQKPNLDTPFFYKELLVTPNAPSFLNLLANLVLGLTRSPKRYRVIINKSDIIVRQGFMDPEQAKTLIDNLHPEN